MSKDELITILKDLEIKEIKNITITYVYEKNYGYGQDKTRTITIGDDK